MHAEYVFPDGNVTGAVRIGNTVHRRTGVWTEATHRLLRHLEQEGFQSSPRVIGFDESGREVLTYIPGATDADPRVNFGTDAMLESVAQLLRRYHDVTITFDAPPDAPWWFQVGAPTAGDVIGHNDIAPWNTIVKDGTIAAFVDWDFAAPGPRVWDIAHAVWRFAPLYDDLSFGTIVEQARRVRVFCEAYGLHQHADLVTTILRRQRALRDSIVAWANAGNLPFVMMRDEGHLAMVERDIAYVGRYRDQITHLLTHD